MCHRRNSVNNVVMPLLRLERKGGDDQYHEQWTGDVPFQWRNVEMRKHFHVTPLPVPSEWRNLKPSDPTRSVRRVIRILRVADNRLYSVRIMSITTSPAWQPRPS